MQTQREQKHPKERGGGDSAKWSQIGLKLYTTVQQGHILSSLIFSATKIQKSISCENLSLYLDLVRQDENDKLPKSVNGDYRLLNKSQSSCAETNDLIPPCPPQNFVLDNEFSCISSGH